MAALNRAGVTPAARMVARRLLDLDHGNGAWPGYRALSDYCGLAPGTVRNAIGQLQRRGVVVSERRAGLGNLVVYWCVAPERWCDRGPVSLSPVTPTGAGAGVTVSDDMEQAKLDGPVSPPMSPPMSPHGVRSSKTGAESVSSPPTPSRGPTPPAGAHAPHNPRRAGLSDSKVAPSGEPREPERVGAVAARVLSRLEAAA